MFLHHEMFGQTLPLLFISFVGWRSLFLGRARRYRAFCAGVSAASAAPSTVPLETSSCLVLLGMPGGVTGLAAHGSLETKEASTTLLPCYIIRTRVHVVVLLLGSIAVS